MLEGALESLDLQSLHLRAPPHQRPFKFTHKPPSAFYHFWFFFFFKGGNFLVCVCVFLLHLGFHFLSILVLWWLIVKCNSGKRKSGAKSEAWEPHGGSLHLPLRGQHRSNSCPFAYRQGVPPSDVRAHSTSCCPSWAPQRVASTTSTATLWGLADPGLVDLERALDFAFPAESQAILKVWKWEDSGWVGRVKSCRHVGPGGQGKRAASRTWIGQGSPSSSRAFRR